MKRYLFYCLAFINFFILYLDPTSGQVAVIANESVPLESASVEEIANIYQLKVRSWKNNTRITVFNLKPDCKIKNIFYNFIKQHPLSLRKLWLRLQLTGEATPPEAIETEDEMVTKVAATAGAIGFVSKDKVKDNVKIIALIE